MATDLFERSLKVLEEVTSNAGHIQEALLEDILKRNAGTEYLKKFLNGQADKQAFKKNVPIVTYADVKPYIDRVADGESSDIIVADPLIGFTYSTGTTRGEPKLLPLTVNSLEKVSMMPLFSESVTRK